MEYKQYLNDTWYARTEHTNGDDLTQYTSDCDLSCCVPTAIPALVKDLFPKADTPIWFYKRFETELSAGDDHRIYLCFDQVICLCEVWLNGIAVGKHIHSEEPFTFDITDALKCGENLLACRVYGPVTDRIGPDGIAMDNTPNFAQIYSYYTVIPKTGIYGNVSIQKKPLCAIDDLYINPDPKIGTVSLSLTLKNQRETAEYVTVDCLVSDHGTVICSSSAVAEITDGGTAVCEIVIPLKNVHLWSPDDPYLYDLSLTVRTDRTTETRQKRFGFKSFCVEDGWFVLNGKRIWLSCAHSIEGKDAVVHAKTMGFKALRYLSALPSEELLDFCDEIGMMVYVESAVSWGMLDYPKMPEHMAAYLDNMIRRDRNHVSVAIWGIFNEQPGPCDSRRHPRTPQTAGVFDFAVSYLPKMRELDNTRLILLSSGRWDCRADIGSYSNPGSNQWNYGWGAEGAQATKTAPGTGNPNLDPYIVDVGDNHLYPTVPLQNDTRDFIRQIGRNTNPVFLSEYGVGYQLDLHDLLTDLQSTMHPEHPSIPYYAIQLDHLERWITHYGLEHVYPTSHDFLMASIYAGAEQRKESIDPIRANPKLCGYSLTSFSVGNEGVYYRDGSLIPSIVSALRDSFAPLKWSIFMDSTQLYADTPFTVEFVLCNEDVLPADDYSAVVSVAGARGVVFRETLSFAYPAGQPLAASVMQVKIPGLRAGSYTVSVWLNGHRQPTCDSKRFRVHDTTSLPTLTADICTIGDLGAAYTYLQDKGINMTTSADAAKLIVVGTLTGSTKEIQNRQAEILQLAWNGKRVLILDDHFWDTANTSAQQFMQSIDYSAEKADDLTSVFGHRIYVRNWLYHMDSYIADADVFAGLADVGLLDMDLFRRVYPDHYLIGTTKPETTICASFGSGLFAQDSCIAALTMGRMAFGEGSVTVNTFKLLENIGSDPVSDRILYNLIALGVNE